MANRTVTLYIDDTSLRLMVTQGRQIKEWAESPLKPGLIEDNVILDEVEITDRIKQLFEVQKVESKNIVLGISGIRCLTRPIVFPRLPKEMLDEAVRREAQRVLPVSLEEIYLSWQTIPAAAEQTQVFIVGIPRKTADALFRVLQNAGLKVGFMEIKPLILAGIVKDTTAIMIDVQPTEFDTVLLVDGIPRPVRSTRFASGTLSSSEKLSTIKSELTRSLAYYNTNNPEKPLNAGVPVYISGDLTNEIDLYKSLSVELGHPVLPLPSPLECPEGLDPSRYMANIALAFHEISPKEKGVATAITLNAVPAVYQTKAVSLTNVLPLPAAVVTVGLIFFLVMFARSVASDITSINTKLTSTNQLFQQRQEQRQEMEGTVAALQKKISAITASSVGLTSVLGVLETQATATNLDLAAAMGSLPQNVNLGSISYVASVLTITGKSPSEKQVLSYITQLDNSGRFANIVITDMTRDANDEINFTLVGTGQTQGIGASNMAIALGSLPAGVNLNNVTSDKGTLVIDGVAPNADKVFAYLRALEASDKFTEITITSMTKTLEGNTNFALFLR